ncbi:MAG TPA: YraN family protein [Dehalococcoidales bacterium]|nr:YraN family protein [Dehalococcoidales bacterium]
MERQDIGSLGEILAQKYLKKKGYRIIETNYRCPMGEIDIVALHKKCLVLVEVRTKTSPEYGSPEESITSTKALHMERAAEYYRQAHPKAPVDWRIDLIAIEMDNAGNLMRLEQIESALEE